MTYLIDTYWVGGKLYPKTGGANHYGPSMYIMEAISLEAHKKISQLLICQILNGE
jgi:hypothetical protein